MKQAHKPQSNTSSIHSSLKVVSIRYEKLVPRHSFPRKKLTLWSSLLRNPVDLWIEILLIEIHTALPIMSYPNQIRIHLTVTHTSHGIEITFIFFRDGKEHDQCSNITYCRLKICVYSGCFKLIKTEMYPHSTGRRSCLHHKQWALWPGNSGQPVLPRISKVSKKKQIDEQTIYCCQLFSNPPEKLSAFASALLDIWCYPA